MTEQEKFQQLITDSCKESGLMDADNLELWREELTDFSIAIWQAAIATRNEEVKELEAEIERQKKMRTALYKESVEATTIEADRIEQLQAQVTKLSGASGFCLQCEASAKVVEQLQAQVAQLRDALMKTWDCVENATDEEASVVDNALTASPSNWLEKKLLGARIDEQMCRMSQDSRLKELLHTSAALEGERE